MPVIAPEKQITCPSCGRDVAEKFCSRCGEQIRRDKEHLKLKHYAQDVFQEITDVDSKLVRTFSYLILRPGFLTKEAVAGRNNLYIKPFRLYMILVVVHFLLFSSFRSADIFSADRLPVFRLPAVREMIKQEEQESNMPHVQFNSMLSQKIKDNLGVLVYLVVFVVAFGLFVTYRRFSGYYVEHLFFAFHLFCFSFLRNLLFIPLALLNLMGLGMVLAVVTQVVYTFLALKTVYPQRPLVVAGKTAIVLLIFSLTLFAAVLASLFLAFYQFRNY